MTTSAKRGQEPYYEADGITLYWGDCTTILAELGPVDACITDPPYGETSLEWDRWPSGWPALVADITSNLWCFGSMRMFTDQWRDFDQWSFAQDIVWEKHNGSSFVADRFKRVHEHALHFYRGKWTDLYRDVQKEAGGRNFGVAHRSANRTKHTGQVAAQTAVDDGLRLLRSVLKVDTTRGDSRHPTEKPLGILDPLVRFSCPRGGGHPRPLRRERLDARGRSRVRPAGHRHRGVRGVLRGHRCAPCTRRPVWRVGMTSRVNDQQEATP